jgi:DNA polymerase III gamma/tau subunit
MAFKAGHKKVGGRKTLTATESAELLRRTAQRAGPKVIRKLVEIVAKSKEDSDVIAAGRILLERAYGRAAEQPEPAPPEQKMTLEEAQSKIQHYMRQMLGPELFEQYKACKATTASNPLIIEASKPVEQPRIAPAPAREEKPRNEPPRETDSLEDNRARMPSFLGGPAN